MAIDALTVRCGTIAIRTGGSVMDNDLISRSALGIGYANPLVFDNPAFAKGWNAAIEIIAKVPAVDAVPVVRCKDCIHYEKYPDYANVCWNKAGMLNVYDDGFCSYGERRTERALTE